MNDLDDDINCEDSQLYIAKYVDDLTIIDTADMSTPTEVDGSGNRPMHTIYPQDTQKAFDDIRKKTEEKELKINEKKTQILSISSAAYDTTAKIKTNQSEWSESGEELKVLGFVFSNKPTVEKQVEKLIRKANKRYFTLIKYKKAGIPKQRLRDIYSSVMRSVLEFSSVVYTAY